MTAAQKRRRAIIKRFRLGLPEAIEDGWTCAFSKVAASPEMVHLAPRIKASMIGAVLDLVEEVLGSEEWD